MCTQARQREYKHREEKALNPLFHMPRARGPAQIAQPTHAVSSAYSICTTSMHNDIPKFPWCLRAYTLEGHDGNPGSITESSSPWTPLHKNPARGIEMPRCPSCRSPPPNTSPQHPQAPPGP